MARNSYEIIAEAVENVFIDSLDNVTEFYAKGKGLYHG